jgi:uncharacterized SAM-binding protein YcdF (DUF218 family)
LEPGELKPILTALVLPPTGPLLLALAALLLATRRRAAGLALAAACIVLAIALGSHAVARLLARELLPEVAAVQPQQLRDVQAIVVLGAGVWPDAPEYGAPQPNEPALVRLRYAVRLARQTGKPLAFAGGVGWAGAPGAATEGSVTRRVLQEDYGLALRWLDDRSRDTAENADRMAELARPDGVRRIALVTDAVHMPRAAAEFRRAGFEVVPAPTDFLLPKERELLEWLPSTRGLAACRYVIREWLGRLVARAVEEPRLLVSTSIRRVADAAGAADAIRRAKADSIRGLLHRGRDGWRSVAGCIRPESRDPRQPRSVPVRGQRPHERHDDDLYARRIGRQEHS